jgi:hypothetical protein
MWVFSLSCFVLFVYELVCSSPTVGDQDTEEPLAIHISTYPTIPYCRTNANTILVFVFADSTSAI